MTGHTPGPWLVYGEDPVIILRADGCSLGEMSAGAPDVSHSEQIANARISAAAPELLEAVKLAEGRMVMLLGAELGDSDHPTATHYCIAQARAAIAKATGQ